jgi:hypothetical protein
MVKANVNKLQVKGITIVFFYMRGVILIESIPAGQTVNQKLLGGPDQSPRTGETMRQL